MDFMNRGVQPNRPAPSSPSQPEVTNHNTPEKKSGGKFSKFKGNKFTSIISFLLFASVAIVIIGLAVTIFLSDSNKEKDYVDSSKMQAVFLNNGQVYFGNITELNNNYLTVSNVYYLRVNQQVQPGQQNAQAQNDVSLVKLGCELHGPQDLMIINRSEVTFWENLKSDGQVGKAVAEYVKQNPNGQNCNTPQQGSSNTNSTNSTTTDNKASSGTTTTPNSGTTNNTTNNDNKTNNNTTTNP